MPSVLRFAMSSCREGPDSDLIMVGVNPEERDDDLAVSFSIVEMIAGMNKVKHELVTGTRQEAHLGKPRSYGIGTRAGSAATVSR